jgi:hypothetical protein
LLLASVPYLQLPRLTAVFFKVQEVIDLLVVYLVERYVEEEFLPQMLFDLFLLMKELSNSSYRDANIVLTVYQRAHELDSSSIRVTGLCHSVFVALHGMSLA